MTQMLAASLGMYDYPWVAEANDALWADMARRLRAAGVDAPEAVSRDRGLHQLWRDPNLLFGQTCGYPYVTALRGETALVATPIYAFAGCKGAWHRSFILVDARHGSRALADFAGARAALNGRDSNSGMNLFRAAIAPLAKGGAFFGQVIVTGSHEASMAALCAGKADIAAIDCVSFALLARGRPELAAGLAIVAETPRSPALPFIMSAALAPKYLGAARAALLAALKEPALAAARATLGLAGAEILGDADYQRVAAFEEEAIAAGYPTLA